MNGLRRNAPPLLRTVRNKPHATPVHHEEDSPKDQLTARGVHDSARSVEDVNRDPDSDSDSEAGGREAIRGWKPPPPRTHIRAPRRRVVDAPASVNIHGAKSSTPRKVADVSSKSRASGGAETAELGGGLDAEDAAERTVFSQGSQKRQRAGYGKATVLKKPRTGSQGKLNGEVSKEKVGFRRPVGQSEPSEDSDRSEVRLSLSKSAHMNEDQPKSSPVVGPLFRRPIGAGDCSLPASTETSATAKDVETRSLRSRSSSLSSLSVSEPDDVVELQRPRSSDQVTSKPCPICGEQVDEAFKNDFLIAKCQGKRMTFRLQELFCKSHKERAAHELWKDREYPEIDWDGLHERLQKHNERIRDVLYGNVRSSYREELEKRLRSGKTKTTMQTMEDDAHSGPQVGYYGSRGEKVMTDHIVNIFGSELRQGAGSDTIISAMGVSGGISGYLQSVLVPELALALVMEDAGCSAEEGRQIIIDSSEIGDAVNEAEVERVPQEATEADND